MIRKIFRGSLLGGFNRKDVMYYVEKTADEFKEEITALREQLELMRSQRDELRYRLEISENEKTVLQDKLRAFEK